MKHKVLGFLVCLVVILSLLGLGTAALAADPASDSATGVVGGAAQAGGIAPSVAKGPPADALIAVDNGYGTTWSPDDPSYQNYPNGIYLWTGEYNNPDGSNHAHAFIKFDVPAHPGYVNGAIKFGAYNNHDSFGDADDVSAVYYFADNSWSQATLTWNSSWNQTFQSTPGPVVDSVAIPLNAAYQYYEWDVTSVAASVWKNGGTLTLVIARANEGVGDYWRNFENLFSGGGNPAYLTGPTTGTNAGARVWQLDSEIYSPSAVTEVSQAQGFAVVSNYEMEKNNSLGDDGQTGSVVVPAGESQTWIADQTAMADVTYAADGAWKVELSTDTPWIDDDASGCKVLIGQWDGLVFKPFSSVFNMFSVTWDTEVGKYIFELQGQSGDETVEMGNNLAIQITNKDGIAHIVYTGEGNYASCLTSPENDPGYPLPEMAAGILAGLGLAGLAAFVIVKSRKAKAVLS